MLSQLSLVFVIVSTLSSSIVSVSSLSSDPFNCTALPPYVFQPITLTNTQKTLTVKFIPYGGTVTNIWVTNNQGQTYDVVLGFEDPTAYCSFPQHPYFGALIGRVANRIADHSFTLNNQLYVTSLNENNDTLHGGVVGFDRQIWSVETINSSTAILRYTSFDGEMGFPGTIDVTVTYQLKDDNSWSITYGAYAHDDTVIGLTQHTYWNLNGNVSTVTNHILTMPNATTFLEVDSQLIPTGNIDTVTNYPWMDFTTSKAVGKDIANGTVTPTGGYDNAWIFTPWSSTDPTVTLQVMVYSPVSNIQMNIWTDQPSIQFYSGNFLNGTIPAKNDLGGGYYPRYGALALEAQHYPDSVHHQDTWPNVVLRSGETYNQVTKYQFTFP